ncbi:MAG: indole-3-glycerol phosphate synthase TrpC [Chitinophagaceae bacterium]
MNILDEIIAYKKQEVKDRKTSMPYSALEKTNFFKRECFSLLQSLKDESKTAIIAEFKRQSPSKGIINNQANLAAVAKAYAENGAAGISVLTDEKYFGGSNDDLQKARENAVPLLRKEFIVDEWQLVESKSIGADAVLLIASCLTPKLTRQFALLAKNIGLEVLLEIHNEQELDHVCDEVDLTGINNRNLKNFTVDINQSIRLAKKLPAGKIKIAESGIDSVESIFLLKQNGFNGFLMGEYFMKHNDPGKAFTDFILTLKNKNAFSLTEGGEKL